MKDIQKRKDIEFLVDSFYKKVVKDDLIGVFFTEIVQLDWDKHMPVMYDFWESTIFAKAKYKGNPMVKHIELSKKKQLEEKHFNRWLQLWEETVKEHFSGEKANEALKKAKQIAPLMQHKINSAN